MTLTGYANRIARIDLTTGEIRYEAIDPEAARKYIGGRGLGVESITGRKSIPCRRRTCSAS